jgi:hypothetical protein
MIRKKRQPNLYDEGGIYTHLSETRKGDRKKMAQIVVDLCKKYELEHSVEDPWNEQPLCIHVNFHSRNGLALHMEFEGDSCQPNVFVLSWHMEFSAHDNGLIISPEFCYDRNTCHFRKATDICYGMDHLVHVLNKRMAMMQAGTDMIPDTREKEKTEPRLLPST